MRYSHPTPEHKRQAVRKLIDRWTPNRHQRFIDKKVIDISSLVKNTCPRSSVVEQGFRKALAGGSNPSVGFRR